MAEIQFQLKTAPPRPGRNAPVRKRLEHRWAEINDRTAIVVTAPQGFGKTTLLGQWRRNWLARGAFVAWVSLDALDDRARFVDLLLFALRAAIGRESFAMSATPNMLQANRELDALTTLLAEVSLLATPTVVILDDVHRMPQESMRELLAYLLNNAPPNLQFVVGSRRSLEVPLTDLMAVGQVATLDARDLRLALDESLEILRGRFGARISLDDAVHLHDLTEGWPLGLQLAASTIEGASDLHEVVGQLSGRRGDIHRFFFESLLARLPPEEASFFVRVSILEVLNADLCEAVTGDRDAGRYLDAVVQESPLVTADENRNWLRVHAMARDFLLGQFDKLPAEERRGCYERAAAWYAGHALFQDAARHALAAGNDELAVGYVARCLRDIASEGRLVEAIDWMRRLSPKALSLDVHLQLTVAWLKAVGDSAAEVPALVEKASGHPQFDAQCRFEAKLIKAAAGSFLDQPGLLAEALGADVPIPPGATPLHLSSLANTQSVLALLTGDTEGARRVLAPLLASASREPVVRLPLGFGDSLFALSYLLEGNPRKAVAVLQPRLECAERELGRRSGLSAILAGTLAAALFLLDQTEQALATLADRLDVIERGGLPDPIWLAYRTLAEVALRRGEEVRALEILVALRDIGLSRNLPRLTLGSLAEQVRVHAVRGRSQTAAELLAQIEAMGPVFEQPTYRALAPQFERRLALATAYACVGRSDFEGAESALATATQSTPSMRRSADTLVARALQALVASERGRPEARAMLAEVLSLADLAGIRRYVVESHPRLADLSASVTAGGAPADASDASAVERAQSVDARTMTAGHGPAGVMHDSATGGLLTPKEARILALLAAGKANKEIARAMDIGEQTVKWHLKNVFFKLNAASRKHAVDRARLLGLLQA